MAWLCKTVYKWEDLRLTAPDSPISHLLSDKPADLSEVPGFGFLPLFETEEEAREWGSDVQEVILG